MAATAAGAIPLGEALYGSVTVTVRDSSEAAVPGGTDHHDPPTNQTVHAVCAYWLMSSEGFSAAARGQIASSS
jgi:hypothetical protein